MGVVWVCVVAGMKLQSFTAIQSLEKPFSALFLLFAALQISERLGWDLNPLHKQLSRLVHWQFYQLSHVRVYVCVHACVCACMRGYTGELALSCCLVAVCIVPRSLSNVLHMWCEGVGLVHSFELPFYIYIHRYTRTN